MNTKHTKPALRDLLANGTVSFFGYKETQLPQSVAFKTHGRVGVFYRNGAIQHIAPTRNLEVTSYGGIPDIHLNEAAVCFLDHEALRALAVQFPAHASYVLVRLAFRKEWIVGALGLLRRLFKGYVRLGGVVPMKAGRRGQLWLLTERKGEKYARDLFLSERVGVQGFLDYLNREKANYVVLRFYEKLPLLYREGADLDILVSDEDEEKVRAFIKENPGTLAIDMWSPSLLNRATIPYYSPPLAQKILASAVRGPANSRIPAPREDFLSLAYHTLYHKGTDAGIPSSLPSVAVAKNPDNDYASILSNKAKHLGIPVAITMEALDEYLYEEGWRPKKDTLAKIAERNEWVRERFFAATLVKKVGLGVLILRKSPTGRNIGSQVRSVVESEKFIVIREKEFDEVERERVSALLRGGNWAERGGINVGGAFLPDIALVVLDLHSAQTEGEDIGGGYTRLRALKEKLRKRFDEGVASLVHSTDTTHEAWEYIEVCFPGEVRDIQEQVESTCAQFQLSPTERMQLYLKFIPYYRKKFSFKIKRWIVRRLTDQS